MLNIRIRESPAICNFSFGVFEFFNELSSVRCSVPVVLSMKVVSVLLLVVRELSHSGSVGGRVSYCSRYPEHLCRQPGNDSEYFGIKEEII